MADGTNAGFLREDALLGLVILTDEDDYSHSDNNFTIGGDQCAAGSNPNFMPPATTIEFLDQLTGDRSRWASAVIAGEMSCSSSFGDAIEAVNLREFVSATGENAVFSSICVGDLSSPLTRRHRDVRGGVQVLRTYRLRCVPGIG